jgi:hypothetical protein
LPEVPGLLGKSSAVELASEAALIGLPEETRDEGILLAAYGGARDALGTPSVG